MKISINVKTLNEAYGGGNQFAYNLSKELISNGHECVSNLNDPDINIILIVNPIYFFNNKFVSYSVFDAINYKKKINHQCILIHRVNDCDQRKKINSKYHFLKNINWRHLLISKYFSHTIFVSHFMKEIYKKINKNYSIIHTGGNKTIYNFDLKKPFNNNRIKLVSHHWSSNEYKGWDFYMQLDDWISSINNIDFYFAGNIPKNTTFKSIKYEGVLSGSRLAKFLNEKDIYITASINEPGGNHVVEALLSGLPVLYRVNGGGTKEMVNNCGMEFVDLNDFKSKLNQIIKSYAFYKKNLSNYNYTHKTMTEKYLEIFNYLIKTNDDIKNNYKFRIKILDYIKIFLIGLRL